MQTRVFQKKKIITLMCINYE